MLTQSAFVDKSSVGDLVVNIFFQVNIKKHKLQTCFVFLFLAACCVILPSSCSTLNQAFEQVKPTQDMHMFSDKAVLLDLPFESQKTPNLCGLASVEMLTRYYGLLLSDAQRQSMSDEAAKSQGISGAMLKAIMEQAGYSVAVFPGTVDRELTGIYRHLDSRRPLIVMTGTVDGKNGHYSLLIGYDTERNLVALLDPARGYLAVPLENFKKKWIQTNHFTLLAIPTNMQNDVVEINRNSKTVFVNKNSKKEAAS